MDDLTDIKLPTEITLEDRIRMDFNKFLMHNNISTEREKDGSYYHRNVGNMWMSCKIGARVAYSVIEERLLFQIEQNKLLKARIKELESMSNSPSNQGGIYALGLTPEQREKAFQDILEESKNML